MKYTTDEALRNWFAYHPPSSPDIVAAHEFVRERYGSLALYMNSLLPEGPDKTVALRAIRDASMQANAAIACAQKLHPEAEFVLNSPVYVDVTAAITANPLAVVNETFAATIDMEPEVPNAEAV